MAEEKARRNKKREPMTPEEREEYEAMLLLERLESLLEEMADLGVRDSEDVRRQIAALHEKLDRAG